MKEMKFWVIDVPLLLIIASIIGCGNNEEKIAYGIIPNPYTILPIIAEKENWYEQEGLKVELKLTKWGDIMKRFAAGEIDVAIQNFSSFQLNYHNVVKDKDINFFYPLYVFKGPAIMIRKNSGIRTLGDYLEVFPDDRENAVVETVKQLKGKHIITIEGKQKDRIVLDALEKAGLRKDKDVKITQAPPAEGLNAFLAGEGDAYSGGQSERAEAVRHGAMEMIEFADLNPPVLYGLVTTKSFAEKYPEKLLLLIELWFKTITWMEEDLDKRCQIVLDYLSNISSAKYSVEEYKYTWLFANVYPKDAKELDQMLLKTDSRYYWKRNWDANNNRLLAEGKISEPIPYNTIWFEKAHSQYIVTFDNN